MECAGAMDIHLWVGLMWRMTPPSECVHSVYTHFFSKPFPFYFFIFYPSFAIDICATATSRKRGCTTCSPDQATVLALLCTHLTAALCQRHGNVPVHVSKICPLNYPVFLHFPLPYEQTSMATRDPEVAAVPGVAGGTIIRTSENKAREALYW